MTFAYGMTTHRRVISALANVRTFQGNESHRYDEGLTGLVGPYRKFLGSRYGALPAAYAVGLEHAEYVVYCYGTPIAWVTNADGATGPDDDPRVNFMPDWSYSPTTTYYQGLVRQAWGDKIVDPCPQETARAAREKRDAANARRRAARAAGRAPTTSERIGRWAAEQVPMTAHRRPVPAAEVPYRDLEERQQQLTRAQLLDPRLADPNWVPGRGDTNRADTELAEARDWERVQATQDQRYPAHP